MAVPPLGIERGAVDMRRQGAVGGWGIRPFCIVTDFWTAVIQLTSALACAQISSWDRQDCNRVCRAQRRLGGAPYDYTT